MSWLKGCYEMKLVSGCLLGAKCRYDGKSKSNDKVIKLLEKEILIPFLSPIQDQRLIF